ncbi:MAG: hypothetical protein QOJ82_1084 [Solirubrobacteraceae bacterium]|jgi:hypothetical protein|nr:hypothetical protein [Solirubrobacteraceae bacterium]MEA2393193.1 hypothetical protein [Solirubrobacteraceae bacterium]
MGHALLVIAAETVEHSKTAYYVCAGALAVWAVILSFVGLRDPDFPGSAVASRGVMALTAVLVLAAMATAVITA